MVYLIKKGIIMKYLQGMLSGFLMAMCFVLIVAFNNNNSNNISEYKIIDHQDLIDESFKKKIEESLKDGWRLYGDLYYYEGYYTHIMVK